MQWERLIIGFSGKPRSGKTEGCKHLANKYGFKRYEMSQPVVAEAKAWMESKGLNINDYSKEDYRLILEGFGHFMRIAHGEDYWINQVLAKVVGPAALGGIRYINEVKKIKETGGFVVRVKRKAALNKDTAATEIQLDKYKGFDLVVNNNRTLGYYHQQLDKFIESLK